MSIISIVHLRNPASREAHVVKAVDVEKLCERVLFIGHGRLLFDRDWRRCATVSALIGCLSAHYRLVDLSVREPEIEATARCIYEACLLDGQAP